MVRNQYYCLTNKSGSDDYSLICGRFNECELVAQPTMLYIRNYILLYTYLYVLII